MLIPAFQFNLNNAILRGLATIAKYDGKHPSLTCGTVAGKVIIHCPHIRDSNFEHEVRLLNINKNISALGSGPLSPSLNRDILLIGTNTNLSAFDVENNSDLFYRDVPDGINALLLGPMAPGAPPLALAGGNCTIQGFDAEGNDVFWTVTGDNVSSMAFCDVDEDGQMELLVGSEDYEIRIFQQERVIMEATETDKVTGLAPIRRTKFGYALGNGTVGVYDKSSRVWRVKSKNVPTAIMGFDLDQDGVAELISGWSNGRFEVRSDVNGEILFKDNFSAPISAILSADYRLDGKTEIICCAEDGHVRAFLPGEAEMSSGGTSDAQNSEVLRELNQRKQELLMELNTYTESIKSVKARKSSSGSSQEAGLLLPADTKINVVLEPDKLKNQVSLTVSTNNSAVIRALIVAAEQLFDGETLLVHPSTPSASLVVPLKPARDSRVEMSFKILAGLSTSSSQFHVFESSCVLPKFAMYMPCLSSAVTEPASSLTCSIADRCQRVLMWIQQSFLFPTGSPRPDVEVRRGTEALDFHCVSVRNNMPLIVRVRGADTASNPGPNRLAQLTILCDDMDVVGEVVQDLSAHLQLSELESIANFPQEMEQFKSVLVKVDEYNSIRLKLTAEMADSSNLVKALIVKGEDARLLSDMDAVKRNYSDLQQLNSELIGEHLKRTVNHNNLLAALKEVNQMIQKASKLRVGAAKARVVSLCRAAIKANNIQGLFQIIQTGNDAS